MVLFQMKKLGAKFTYNDSRINVIGVYGTISTLILVSFVDVYLIYGLEISVQWFLFVCSAFILRGAVVTSTSIFLFGAYHIYVRYRVLNNHLRFVEIIKI